MKVESSLLVTSRSLTFPLQVYKKDTAYLRRLPDSVQITVPTLLPRESVYDKKHVRLDRDPIQAMLSKTGVQELTRKNAKEQKATTNEDLEETPRMPAKRSRPEATDVPKHMRL